MIILDNYLLVVQCLHSKPAMKLITCFPTVDFFDMPPPEVYIMVLSTTNGTLVSLNGLISIKCITDSIHPWVHLAIKRNLGTLGIFNNLLRDKFTTGLSSFHTLACYIHVIFVYSGVGCKSWTGLLNRFFQNWNPCSSWGKFLKRSEAIYPTKSSLILTHFLMWLYLIWVFTFRVLPSS